MMETLVEWLNSETEIHPILMSGISQFQLLHVHPFRDGNGRTSRLLSTLCLYRAGYDFKRLFTISEYYDRDRAVFYKAIQDVREQNMDMTGWLEYFIEGLATQMQEMVERGKEIIRLDMVTRDYDLSKRQAIALGYVLEHGVMTIQNYEQLCSETNRRTLQRDLKGMVDKGLMVLEGSTNQLIYRLKDGIL
jgi:Fic family protein